MAVVTLTPEEQQILLELVDTAIPDLREEIWHTDDHDYRERLKAREHMLKELQQKLHMNQ